MMELSRDCREILDSMNLWYCVFIFNYSHAALNCDDDYFFPLIWHILLELLTYKKKTDENIFSSGGIFFLSLGTIYFSFHLFCTSLIIYLYIDISDI